MHDWYIFGAWFDALVDGTGWITGCLVQVGAWLMHLFVVHVDYGLIGTCLQKYISH
jgi:hypothetical protein